MAVAVGELWETAKHAIAAYTGLSPAVFFTVVALGFAVYHLVAGFFQPAAAPRTREMDFEKLEPLPPPVQLGEITEEELKVYDGTDPKKPLLMAIKAQIYDVTQSRMFYGPGGPYALFAGKDASRALAKMSFEAKDLTGDISGLNPFELEALQDWEYKLMSKYVKVGTIKKTEEGPSESTSESTVTTLEESHSEETKGVDLSGNDAESKHSADAPAEVVVKVGEETKNDDLSGNDAKAEHSAESKDDDPAEPIVKPGDDGKEAAKKGPVEVDLKDGKKVTTSSIIAE